MAVDDCGSVVKNDMAVLQIEEEPEEEPEEAAEDEDKEDDSEDKEEIVDEDDETVRTLNMA